jgi:DNA replication protein DnaC
MNATELSAAVETLRSSASVDQARADEWTWKNVTKPDLEARGFESRHVRRIAPNWGIAAQKKSFDLLLSSLQGRGAIIALTGQRGTGKTQMACELCRLRTEARGEFYRIPIDSRAPDAVAPPESGRYVKLGKIGSLFKPLYADFGAINADELMERFDAYAHEHLLIIDEVHESEELKTQMRMLTDLVDRRYAAQKDTVLISNYTSEEFIQNINPSILSRLSEHGRIIPCKWTSFRSK